MSLREAWEEQAPNWIRWAREPGHDSYWVFHRESFLAAVPTPGRMTIDVGCGEGRVTRDLRALGHRVVGIDAAPSMVAAAREADPGGEYLLASGTDLPFEDGAADLAVAFMTLMDMDDMPSGLREIARVLVSGGKLIAPVTHPLNSAGLFSPRDGDETAPFVVQTYRKQRRTEDSFLRNGLEMTFHSIHFTLEDYSRAFEDAGLQITRLRELYDEQNPRWSRVPLFLRFEAVKA
ncbi:MAG TPA: methyltransferase domain-containing protein [Gaiellaceae bacterium]|nr:methyltransferase domain-containing protein [Gaiellaceae bacterium]